jgi:hypothetical protein
MPMLAARLRLPSTATPRDAGHRSALHAAAQITLAQLSPLRSCKVMLGLVQNAKANAVRASLNTDQMVLSHVQVNIMFPLPRFFLSVCLCCLLDVVFVELMALNALCAMLIVLLRYDVLIRTCVFVCRLPCLCLLNFFFAVLMCCFYCCYVVHSRHKVTLPTAIRHIRFL